MVTANLGVASSQLSAVANRVLVDYKDAIQDYRITDMPVISMFAESFTTETGGDVDITFGKPSMKLEQIEEGATPAYPHTDLRNERINVKEWGIGVGVTRRMLEDSRFSEMDMALNEARRAVDRHVTEHFIKTVFGLADATLGTGITAGTANLVAATTEADILDFDDNPHGGFLGATPLQANLSSGQEQRLVEYGIYTEAELVALGSHYQATSGTASATDGELALADLTKAIELLGAKGLNADTILISPSHYKTLLNMADFTLPFSSTTWASNSAGDSAAKGGMDFVNQVSKNAVVGQLYGLNVVVNAYIPASRFGVFDMSIKPVAYVERRGLTVEEANPGFGITGSYMSMRYGLKIIRPEAGVIFISA